MHKGVVRPSRADGSGLEAWVEISIRNDAGEFRGVEAVVDSGFTGWLALPFSAISYLNLYPSGTRFGILADGREEESGYCEAVVIWHDHPMDIWVDIMGNTPLIGTDLLSGSRLIIDWWDGGDVIIEERTPPA